MTNICTGSNRLNIFLFLFFHCLAGVSFSQTASPSPFNYGQSGLVYYISSEQLNTFGFQTIVSVDHLSPENLGGMWENWDVLVWSIDSALVMEDWAPINLDSTFVYSYESLLDSIEFLNGNYYHFHNGQLTEAGGEGYGTFDIDNYSRFDDSTAYVMTTCSGHCGEYIATFRKNYYDQSGRLFQRKHFLNGVPEMSDPPTSKLEYEELLQLIAPTSEDYELEIINYDSLGRLVLDGLNMTDAEFINQQIESQNLHVGLLMHQCYIDDQVMESYMQQLLGMKPKLLILQLSNFCVHLFGYNTADHKYYSLGITCIE